MVDNRYSGVGYEPPFETPSDKDFIEMHIKTLKAERDRLKAENERLLKCLADYPAENKTDELLRREVDGGKDKTVNSDDR